MHLTAGQLREILTSGTRRPSLRPHLLKFLKHIAPKARFEASSGHVDDLLLAILNIDLNGRGLRGELQALIRRLNGDSECVLLSEMIAAGNYDKVSKGLTEERFPVKPGRFTTRDSKIHHFNTRMEPKEVIERLRKEGRQLAYLEALLAYGSEMPDDQRAFPIVGMSYAGKTPFLTADADGRVLFVGKNTPSGGYRELCRFLSVPLTD
jgi:hypothetical protein